MAPLAQKRHGGQVHRVQGAHRCGEGLERPGEDVGPELDAVEAREEGARGVAGRGGPIHRGQPGPGLGPEQAARSMP